MVKLLRLTSNKDDDFDNAQEGLVFNVNMEDDLIVSPDAQIALKNLTFESDFRVLSIDQSNGLVSIKYQNTRGSNSMFLSTATYSKTTYLDFFEDLRITLNRCIRTLLEGDPADDPAVGFYGQYYIDPDAQQKEIQFLLTPALNPVIVRTLLAPTANGWAPTSNLMTIARDSDGDDTVIISYDITIPAASLKPYDMCTLSAHTTHILTPVNTRDNYITSSNPNTRWCQGNAVWSIRIEALGDNGGAADTNGFEIGLASGVPFGREGSPILDANVKFAVRCRRATDDIQHIKPNADFTTNSSYVTNTGVAPTNPAPITRNDSDTIVISCYQRGNLIGKKSVKAELFKDNVAVDTLFEYDLPSGVEETSLYPYLCFFDLGSRVSVHSPVCTFDPFDIQNYQDDAYERILQPARSNDFCGTGVFDESVVDLGAIGREGIPDLDNDWYISKGLTQNSFVLMYNDIWNFLGFSNVQLSGVGTNTSSINFIINTTPYPYGFELVPTGVFLLTQSDNFVVILDSQKLISYECSKPGTDAQTRSIDVVGKRANILATIPVHNNDGLVEFQANEVLYIDFDNKGDTAIRNLKLRVLDKSLQPIDVLGLSVMTLLIKD